MEDRDRDRGSSKFFGGTDIDKSTGSLHEGRGSAGGSRGSAGSMIAPMSEKSDSNEGSDQGDEIKVYDRNNFPYFNADPPGLLCIRIKGKYCEIGNCKEPAFKICNKLLTNKKRYGCGKHLCSKHIEI